MVQSFQAVTVFKVKDRQRGWGPARDILMEYPSCKNRYLGVEAHVGAGMKVIWAPIESVVRLDQEHFLIYMDSDIDRDLVKHLGQLEAPTSDVEELKLQHLYHRRPEWTDNHYKPDGSKRKYNLRKHSRMIRLSSLLDWTTMLRDGAAGKIIDLLLNPKTLQIVGFELKLFANQQRIKFQLDEGCRFLLDKDKQTLFVDWE